MRGRLKFLFGLGLIFSKLVFPVKATDNPDSLRIPANRPVKFVFNFDARYTLFRNDPIRVGGVKAGLEFKNQFRAGIGLYGLKMPVITGFPALPYRSASSTEMNFRYAAVYGEWLVLKNRRWEISLPLQVGFGKVQTRFYDGGHYLLHTEQNRLLLVEPAVAGHYKIFSWIGVGAGAGYRQNLNQRGGITRELNAPIYSLKAKIFLGDLYRQFRVRLDNRRRIPENQPGPAF